MITIRSKRMRLTSCKVELNHPASRLKWHRKAATNKRAKMILLPDLSMNEEREEKHPRMH